MVATLAVGNAGPTRVRGDGKDADPRALPIAYENPGYATRGPYGPWGYVATPEIVSRIGEILGAIDSPQDRNRLAQQWLQFSQQTIVRDQEFRNAWLDVQRQQLHQQQQARQYEFEIPQLQMRIEELRAANLRLEQENLAAQQRLAQQAGAQARRPE
ncbi:MAG: hypothetical protein FJ280_17150 [Planctomycetes bacterium]|nr:hypothetical protein [Planctomycetota bacterium]